MNTESVASALVIRQATISDVPVILNFIKELAEYEQLLHEVVATEDELRANLLVSAKWQRY